MKIKAAVSWEGSIWPQRKSDHRLSPPLAGGATGASARDKGQVGRPEEIESTVTTVPGT